MTNHPSIPTIIICTNVNPPTGGFRTSLTTAVWEVIGLHPCKPLPAVSDDPKEHPVHPSGPSAPKMPIVSNVIHPAELLIHWTRFTGGLDRSVTQARAQEYHSPASGDSQDDTGLSRTAGRTPLMRGSFKHTLVFKSAAAATSAAFFFFFAG